MKRQAAGAQMSRAAPANAVRCRRGAPRGIAVRHGMRMRSRDEVAQAAVLPSRPPASRGAQPRQPQPSCATGLRRYRHRHSVIFLF